MFLNKYACDPAGIRTQDPQLRRLLLYPAELPDQFSVALEGSLQKSLHSSCKVSDFSVSGKIYSLVSAPLIVALRFGINIVSAKPTLASISSRLHRQS